MFSMMEPPVMSRRMYPREEDDWSDYQHHYGVSHGVNLSVLPNRKIGPALNESPSRPRGKIKTQLNLSFDVFADNKIMSSLCQTDEYTSKVVSF